MRADRIALDGSSRRYSVSDSARPEPWLSTVIELALTAQYYRQGV